MNQNRPEGWDWRAELGRHEGRAANETLSDQVSIFKFVGKLLTLPIRLPLYMRRVILRRRDMLRFAEEMSANRLVSDELIREVTLCWVEDHADRYPLGEYDPRVRRLQRTFEAMMRRRS